MGICRRLQAAHVSAGISIGLLFVIGIVAGSTQGVGQQGPPSPPVSIAPPLAKRVTNWDEYAGRFEAIRTVDVRPRVSGIIEAIHFKDGQIVKAGDPLFTIDQRPFMIAADVSRAEIARAKAQVLLQESEVDRATPLARSGTLTGRELETRQANLAIARAQLASADANARNAELNLEWTVVRAPIDGRVSDRKVDVGNLVTAAQNPTLLTTIVSTDPIHFLFEISEADFLRYGRLYLSGTRPSSREVSNPVRVRLADERSWTRTGRMNFVDNQLNPRSGTLRGRAVIDNPDELLQPGLFGRIQVFGGENDALLIPDSAVISDQARKVVFTVGADGIVKPQPVTLGGLSDGLRVVLSGLAPDTLVVVDGLANPMVRPGAKVAVQRTAIKEASN